MMCVMERHARSQTHISLSARETGVLATTVQNGGLERSGPRAADNTNTTIEVTLAFEAG